MEELRACPNCEQGKHHICDGEVIDDSATVEDILWVCCPCAEVGHTKKEE